MLEIFPFTKALRTLADGKVLMNSHAQPVRHRIKDGKYELNSFGKWVVQSYFYMNADEMKAEWWEVEPEPEWKEAKWWEAANVLLEFPDRDYVKFLTADKKWVNVSSEMINEFNVKEFSEIRFRVMDFETEAE